MPWPSDFVYRSNGRKTSYDTMSVQEFVIWYCHIIVSNIPVSEDTGAALDHIFFFAYLSDLRGDSEGSDWETVRNSHRQILHMVEQGQLRWEDEASQAAHCSKHLVFTRPAVQQSSAGS